MKFENNNGALVCYRSGEKLEIRAWGEDSLRIRATMQKDFTGNDWALTEKVSEGAPTVTIGEEDFWVGDGSISKQPTASIVNGRIKAVVNFAGVISFYRLARRPLAESARSFSCAGSRSAEASVVS